MSRLISDILETDLVKFNHLIKSWEERTGHEGVDLKLYSDLRHKALKAAEKLGLDPTDTIPKELYFALQERAKQDNTRLSMQLNTKDHDSPQDVINKAVKWTLKESLTDQVWAVKQIKVKSILKKCSPKATTKAMGLRSIDSMLKRINTSEVLASVNQIESDDWQEKLINEYKKLKPSDFDNTKIKGYVFDKTRTKKLIKAGYPANQFITPCYELGSFVVLPFNSRFPLDVLATVTMLAEIIYEIRKHSALYRILSVRKDFGNQVSAIALEGVGSATNKMSEIGWNSLHRHLVGNEYVISRFEQPYWSSDDLRAESSIDFLVRNDPEFEYWKDLEYTFFHNDNHQPVSLNLIDVAVNSSNKIPHHESSMRYGKMRLWEELWARYLKSDHVIDEIVDDYLRTT